MKAIDNYILEANKLLMGNNDLVNHDKNKKIKDGGFDGYINGFGPTVISSGLIPTLATYSADPKKCKVLDMICRIANISEKKTGSDLFNHCLVNFYDQETLWNIKEEIVTASIALKLVIRTFDLSDK